MFARSELREKKEKKSRLDRQVRHSWSVGSLHPCLAVRPTPNPGSSMIKKILLVAAFTITPLLLSEEASAQCASYGYGAYRAPVVRYQSVPHYSHRGHYASPYHSGYRGSGFSYGAQYGSPYRYGSRYGGYGYGYGSPYYGRGTSIGIGRGGISLNFGF